MVIVLVAIEALQTCEEVRSLPCSACRKAGVRVGTDVDPYERHVTKAGKARLRNTCRRAVCRAVIIAVNQQFDPSSHVFVLLKQNQNTPFYLASYTLHTFTHNIPYALHTFIDYTQYSPYTRLHADTGPKMSPQFK